MSTVPATGAAEHATTGPAGAAPIAGALRRVAFEFSPLGMVMVGLDGVIIAANPALARILGVRAADLVGRHVGEFLVGADARSAAELRDFLAGRDLHCQRTARLLAADGREVRARVSGAIVPGEGKEPPMALAIVEDVSQQHAVGLALRRSEERLALALDATATGWWEHDTRTGHTRRSPQALVLLGADTAAPDTGDLEVEPNGTSVWTLAEWRRRVHPDDQALVAAAFDAHLRGDSPDFDVEYRLRTFDGGWRWVHARGSVVEREADGRVRRVVGTESDVTARKLAEQSLRRSERRFRGLIEHASDTISVVEPGGRIVYASPSHLAVLGWSPEELEHVALTELVHPDDLARMRMLFRALLAEPGATASADARLRHRSGEWRALDIVASNLLDDPAIGGIVFNSRDVTDRRAAEQAVSEAAERLRLVARATNDAIYDYDLVHQVIGWNEGLAALWGYPRSLTTTPIEWWDERLHPDDAPRVVAGLTAAIDQAGRDAWRDEYRFRRADGTYALVLDRGYMIRDADGRPMRMVGAMTDLSERRRLEEQLRHAQKMEAVGQLAGGIAHDFNNLLTVMFSGLELTRAALPADSVARRDVDEVMRAAQSAATLTRQLLAFSRKQVLQPRTLDLNLVVDHAEGLLRRAVGERVALEVQAADDLWLVHADPGQVEQVLLNLVVNARDALPEGGVIRVETYNQAIDAAAATEELPAGDYVCLAVHDTGIGMDAPTRARIFEPFFTTKEVGRGTGLGLATVYGIVTQSGGAVQVESTPGAGSSFRILLPRSHGVAALGGKPLPTPPRGTETILVVEDEAPVRTALRRTLERFGYVVLEARTGVEGLDVWHANRERVAAVLTDLRMPELGGRELAAQLRLERPRLPVVFISGYADEAQREIPLAPGEAFLAKPFVTEALLATLRRVIEGARR